MDDILKTFPMVLKQLGADNAAIEQLVFAAWRRSVDGALASNVVPVRLEGKRLYAAVPNETWRRQIADLGPILVDRMNRKLGMEFVKFVTFEIEKGSIVEELVKGSASKSPDDLNIAPLELHRASQAISDETLRRTFLAAAGRSLLREAAGNE